MAESQTASAPENQSGKNDLYGSFYFRHDCGIPYERNAHWLGFFGRVADGIIRDLAPASVFDAGCAMGFLVESLHQRGVDAWGVDISEYAISQVDDSVRDRCAVASLSDPIDRRYDLITCIEVLEHIPPAEADRVIANLSAATDRILLSSTPQDYAEPTHLNVQPPEAWSAALAREGFLRDLDRDFSYLSPWTTLYVRKDEDRAETVRRYDRAWWRLRWEVIEQRNALLRMQSTIAEAEKEGIENERWREVQTRQAEEILRLRDELVGQEAELGLARGQAAQLQDQLARLENMRRRVQDRVPGPLWTIMSRLWRGRG